MAVFGPQLIYTLIMFVMLTRLGKFYSFGRYLLCNKLFRYLSPPSDDLKKAVRNYYKNANNKNKKLNRLFEIDDAKEEFNIPEGATIELAMSPVQPYDLYYIKYTDDFQSFTDVSLIAIFIYATTEIYLSFFKPADEINLSVVWCGMALLYGIATLTSIAKNYLRTSEAPLLYVFAGLSFLISFTIQLADTKLFDFQLKDAFRNFSSNTLLLIQTHINETLNESSSPITVSVLSSKHSRTTAQKIYSQLKTYSTNDLLFSCTIASLSAFIGAILFFPSFRLARLHYLCIKYSQGSKLKKLIFYINFLVPLMVTLCWFKNPYKNSRSHHNNSITLDTETKENEKIKNFISLITNNDTLTSVGKSNLSQFGNTFYSLLINVLTAENLKIYLIIFIFVLRVTLYRFYAQSYLNLAFELATNLRKKSTKITNLKYISTISSIYQYYGVVASQYIIPLFILLFLVFLLKTLGEFSWCGDSVSCNRFVNLVTNYTLPSVSNTTTISSSILKQFENAHFNVTLGHNILNKIFTPLVLRSLIGYFTFWTCSIWFLISCFGLFYYNYIDVQVLLD